MGCVGFVLTNYQPELEEYFTNSVDFVSYGSMDEAVELAKYYLRNDDARMKIAQSGYEKVKANFTYEKQLETIFKVSGLV